MINHKTIQDSPAYAKPHIYVTGHKTDLESCISDVTALLHSVSNCAVYWHDDPEAESAGEDFFGDLDKMNIIVLLLSRRFVSERTAAYERAFAYAVKKHIPVIPILLERGAEVEGAVNSMLRDLHCLDISQADIRDKLREHIGRMVSDSKDLISIKHFFDADLFLSYRKKDRKYAEELIRRIHDIDAFRGLAIWYDDMLIPGENFNDTIREAMDNSTLVLFNVTPNLMEKGNYAMDIEFVHAYNSGKKILPVETVATDKAFRSFYSDPPFPEWVNVNDTAALEQAVFELLGGDIGSRFGDPEHDLFIGLAYRDGAFVEIDKEKALRLIMSAAEKNHPGAFSALRNMYETGNCVERDYEKSIECQRMLVKYYEDNPDKSMGGFHTALQLYYLASDMERFGMPGCVKEYKRLILLFNKMLEQTDNIVKPNAIEYHVMKLAAIAYDRLSQINEKMGYLEKAAEYSESARNFRMMIEKLDLMAKKAPDPRVKHEEINNLLIEGDRNRAHGDPETAKKAYYKAFTICKELLSEPDKLGDMYGHFRRSAYMIEERFALVSSEPEERAKILLGCLQKAEDLSKEYAGVDMYTVDVGQYCLSLTETYCELNDQHSAFDVCRYGIGVMKRLVAQKQMREHIKLLFTLQNSLCYLFSARNDRPMEFLRMTRAINLNKVNFPDDVIEMIADAEKTLGMFDWTKAELGYGYHVIALMQTKAYVYTLNDGYKTAIESIEKAIEYTKMIYNATHDNNDLKILGGYYEDRAYICKSFILFRFKDEYPYIETHILLSVTTDMVSSLRFAEDYYLEAASNDPSDKSALSKLNDVRQEIENRYNGLVSMVKKNYELSRSEEVMTKIDLDYVSKVLIAIMDLTDELYGIYNDPVVSEYRSLADSLYHILN